MNKEINKVAQADWEKCKRHEKLHDGNFMKEILEQIITSLRILMTVMKTKMNMKMALVKAMTTKVFWQFCWNK